MRTRPRHPEFALLCAAVAACGPLAANVQVSDAARLPPPAARPVDFRTDVRPVLAARCFSCHGPAVLKGGLRLHRKTDLLAGGDNGPVVVPGKGGESRLVQYVAGAVEKKVMPPAVPRLTAAQIGLLRAWIDQGAVMPDDSAYEAILNPHWAFRPVRRPPVPHVPIVWTSGRVDEGTVGRRTSHRTPARPDVHTSTLPYSPRKWARSPIDAFLLERLQKAGLTPSPEADRATLIRRVSLDLTGLPPAPEEVARFLADRRADAYERVVDRLLASPHYGERWARHWLDLARYADSNGYTIDSARSIWPFRDWVIQALNADLPFDEFTIHQLAGDLLPDAAEGEEERTYGRTDVRTSRSAEAPDPAHPHVSTSTRPHVHTSMQPRLVATGFHRNTLINEEGGADPEQFRVEAVADRVSTTGTVWLGLTIGCAQCHTHKYDPVTQREYYQLFAFFNNQDEPTLSLAPPEEQQRHEALKAELAAARKTLTDYDAARKQTEAEGENSSDPDRKPLAKRVADLAAREKELARILPSTMILRERSDLRPTHVHLRGDFLRKGVAVRPDVPSVLPSLPRSDKPPTRLDLARWLVGGENPLTARVTVNRIWMQYFGRGLVETENDFGTQGTRPTHPELLDWLAWGLARGSMDVLTYGRMGARTGGRAEAVAAGPTSSTRPHVDTRTPPASRPWCLKSLHRLIVTSATYRQASRQRPELLRADPGNRLLGRQARLRLDAEIVRDSALSASGLLCAKIGGPSVFPPQPAGLDLFTQNKKNWKASEGDDRYRRGIYTFKWRSSPYPLFTTLDAPDGNLACTRRPRSNTPLAALMLANDASLFEMAQALGLRTVREGPADDAGRIRYALRRTLCREPALAELDRLADYLRSERERFRAQPDLAVKTAAAGLPPGVEALDAAAWTAVARVLMNLDEFITRE